MELQPITPDSLDDEALTDLIEIRKSGVDHHASEGNKVQHAIQSLTLIALVELQQRRDADSSDPIYQWRERYEEGSLWDDCTKAQYDGFAKKTDCEVRILYTAPPAPVSVPAAMEMDDDFDSAFEHGKAVGWNACRAALLQGADRPQNEPQNIPENIPATQFKPVADLYGLTSPTGGETSFTFDAVEAHDFIDGGWSCQEYVELGRYQEALTDHSEDKLAMVDHSGDSNNMVEPVTTACKLRDAVDTIRNSGIAIDGEKILAERDALNSPVIPDGWVMVPEEPTHEMLEAGDEQFGTYDVYRRMIEAAPKLE
ncbi:hypothetical protein [Citrobacter freundii]|uniref:hypothetical protein n=1 Tax=Citrobacter freundii TaxID=546 RepID=UPI0023B0019E|nr:hypothetical protein [Citrobacter freundii]